MENPIFLSVIVPVYNVEEYLECCVDSILNQNHKHLEVILVDDGSTDRSLNICECYEKTDNRVAVLKCQHSGVVLTRKTGLKYAHGDYVTFVDSDDWLDPDYYDDFIKYANEGKYDVICGGLVVEYTGGGYSIYEDCDVEEGEYRGNDIVKILSPQMFCDGNSFRQKLSPCLYNKIYKRGTLDNVYDLMDGHITMGDDAIPTYMSIRMCGSVYVMKGHFKYHYRKNGSQSLTGSFAPDYYQRVDCFSSNVDDIIRKNALSDMQEQYNLYKMYLYMRKLMFDCKAIRTLRYAKEEVSSETFLSVIQKLSVRQLDCSIYWKIPLVFFAKRMVFPVYILKLLASIIIKGVSS